jgi:hypothetical protein
MIDESDVRELLRIQDGHLYHREGQELEFKEQFNFAGLAEYFRDFAAFANNRGGYLIFGVKDSPRTPTGLSKASAEQFDKVDPEKITGYLLDIFSADIVWEPALLTVDEKLFGVIRIYEARTKPIIAKKDEGRDQAIKNGEVYYRYGGRTQRIQYAELESIINKRIEKNNKSWLDLMSKIAHAGPQNAAILDTERSLIEKDDAKILVLDENLAKKLKFVKEGQFVTKDGAPTLKLVGDVLPVRKVEIVKRVKETLIREYPLSALELAEAVRGKLPGVKQNDICQAISDNGMKDNPDYSAYNFRNKRQDDAYRETGVVPLGTPSIYNHRAVEFLVKVLGTG